MEELFNEAANRFPKTLETLEDVKPVGQYYSICPEGILYFLTIPAQGKPELACFGNNPKVTQIVSEKLGEDKKIDDFSRFEKLCSQSGFDLETIKNSLLESLAGIKNNL